MKTPMLATRLSDAWSAEAPHKRYVSLGGGRGVWMDCAVPFEVAATELIRDAIRSDKPVPSVLGTPRRTRAQPVPTPTHA